MQKSGGTLSFFLYAFLIFGVLTVVLLSWPRYGSKRELLLDPSLGYVYEARDDRIQGGDSVATVTRQGSTETLNCELNRQYRWPYCQVRIHLKAVPDGVDLSNYDSLLLDVAYRGPGRHSIRVYLRNFEPSVSNILDDTSLKVNEVEFEVPESGRITIPLKVFHLADWWTVARNLPLMTTEMKVDNVSWVEVSTGTVVSGGNHHIDVKSIRFVGQWFDQTQLVMALAGAWFMFSLIWVSIAIKYFRSNLRISKARAVQLQAINQALQLETKELSHQARTDSLTGALNREGLRDFLMTQWSGKIPNDPPVSALIADLDHFKLINDQHGHLVGDRILQEFVQLVQGGIRSSDRLIRWGGEEFLILCQDTRANQGRGLAEKLRSRMEQRTWPEKLPVTASFGVTMHIPGEDLGQLIARADQALYKAKGSGRNRVEVI